MEKASDQAYLLRCWREDGQWRFSVETIGPHHQRLGFRSLEELVAFLRNQLPPPEMTTLAHSPPA